KLGADPCVPIHVDLLPGMQDAADVGFRVPGWAAGAAMPEERRAVVGVTASGQRQDRVRVLTHELAHVAIANAPGPARVPRWLDEGIARTVALEDSTDDEDALARAILADKLLPLTALVDGFPGDAGDARLAYAESAKAVRLLEERGVRPRDVLEAMRNGT